MFVFGCIQRGNYQVLNDYQLSKILFASYSNYYWVPLTAKTPHPPGVVDGGLGMHINDAPTTPVPYTVGPAPNPDTAKLYNAFMVYELGLCEGEGGAIPVLVGPVVKYGLPPYYPSAVAPRVQGCHTQIISPPAE